MVSLITLAPFEDHVHVVAMFLKKVDLKEKERGLLNNCIMILKGLQDLNLRAC